MKKIIKDMNTFRRVRNRKGITVAEVILAMVLMSLVLTLGVQILRASTNGMLFTINETQFQTDARRFATEVNNNVRYATATFTIPKSSFREDNLTPDWNYMGIMENVEIPAEKSHTKKPLTAKRALVSIIAQDEEGNPQKQPEDNLIEVSGGTFIQRILGYSYIDDKGREIDYDLVFNKEHPEETNSKIEYSLRTVVKKTGNEYKYLEYDTALDSLNSLQVIHNGSISDPSVAFAYRKGEKSLTTALVSMVLDTSGSMKWDMAGRTTNNDDIRRITILKKTATSFVNGLSDNENVNIGLFPFGGVFKPEIYGNKKSDLTIDNIFKSSKNDTSILTSRIDNLVANGGTNTGDALRYSYYRAKEYQSRLPSTQKCVKYLIILIDGDTNGWSNTAPRPMQNYNLNFYENDGLHFERGTQDYQYAGGYQGTHYREQGENYMSKFASGRWLSLNPKIFFIVVSNDVTSDGVKAVKTQYNVSDTNLFKATDSTKLQEAFDSIKKSIKDDLWYLNGPVL